MPNKRDAQALAQQLEKGHARLIKSSDLEPSTQEVLTKVAREFFRVIHYVHAMMGRVYSYSLYDRMILYNEEIATFTDQSGHPGLVELLFRPFA